MASKIKGITIELNANATKLDKALKDVNKATKTTQDNLKAVDKALKFDPTNTELLTQKQRLLAEAVEEAGKKVDILKQKQKEMADAVAAGTATQTEYDTLNRKLQAAEGQLDKAKTAAEKFNVPVEKMKGYLDKASEGLEKAADKTRGFSTAAGLVVGSLTGLAIKAGQTADDLNTLSAQTGINTETLQELQYASGLVDVEVGTITGSLKKLTSQMKKAKDGNKTTAEAFEKLGVKVTDANGNLRDNEEVFYDLLEALSQVENETDRDAAAMELFGKSASDLNPIIQDGGKQLKELGKEAKDAGLIMSQDALDGANRFNDALDKLKATAEASFNKVGGELAEALIPVAEELGEWIGKILEWIRGLGADNLLSILKIAVIIAAVSPVLTLLGKISTGLTLILNHPLIIGAVAIAGLIGGIAIAVSNSMQPVNLLGQEYADLAREIEEAGKKIAGFHEDLNTAEGSLQTNTGKISEQYKPYEDLADKLREITDGQGKVLEGHQKEARYILEEMGTAFGVESEIIKGQIKNYDETVSAINRAIAARKANAALAANEATYTEAMERQTELATELTKAQERYEEVTSGLNTAIAQKNFLTDMVAESEQRIQDNIKNGVVVTVEQEKALDDLKTQLAYVTQQEAFYGSQMQAVKGTLEGATEAFSRNQAIIENYDRVAHVAKTGAGDIDTALLMLSNNMRTAATADAETLQKQLEEYETKYKEMRDAVDKQGAKISDAQFANLEKMIDITKTELKKVTGEVVSVGDDWETAFRGMKGRAFKTGGEVATGLAEGIKDSTHVAVTAAQELARRTGDAAKVALGVNSPSKVFAQIGKYTDQGLAKGIIDNLSYVERATTAMTSTLMGVDAGVASTSEGAQVMAAGTGRQPIIVNMTQPIYLGGKTVGNAVTESVIENITAQQGLQAAFVGV